MIGKKVFTNKTKWISAGKGVPAPLFRKEFFLNDAPISASVNICACGFFELYVNGNRVGEDYFKPAWSNYSALESPILDIEVCNYRAYYLTYDVSEYLIVGKNVIAVALGKGWYMQDDNVMQKISAYGDTLKFIAQMRIDCNDGRVNVVTDESFKCDKGFITFTNIYYGERHDYSLYDEKWNGINFDDSEWANAKEESSPQFEITKQTSPSDRVCQIITPKLIHDGGVYGEKIYDVGVNVSGFVEIVSGGGGVAVGYSENLFEYGKKLKYESTIAFDDKTIQRDEFSNTKKGQVISPYFVWHGFRYFAVRGKIDGVVCKVIHTYAPKISEFTCDNKVLNWYYQAFIRTQLNNMHCGVPSDCPHRERKGYTGDGHLCADATMLTLESKEFYRKWIRDILDSQDKNTGFVPNTAPYYGGGGGVGGWGSAIVIVPYEFYMHYGDAKVLEDCFPAMLKWVDCLETLCENGLLTKTQYKIWNLGEWCNPSKTIIPEPFINTYFYVKSLELLEKISAVIRRDCGFNVRERISTLKNALIQNYYDELTDSFCHSVQGADLFALDIGIASRSALNRLAKKYNEKPAFDTGIFGTELLIKILIERGYADVAFKLLSSEKYPSFGYMMKKNATTIWETWDGTSKLIGVNSHNHPMLGAASKQLFYGILGIKQTDCAFKSVIISPAEIKGLNNYSGYILTENGKIQVDFKRVKNEITVSARVDKRIKATLSFREKNIELENGKAALIKVKS